MIVIRWLITTILWLTIWIPVYLLGFFVTWIGLLFCKTTDNHLPKLWWIWDNSHGINGTIDYNNLNWVYICNPTEFVNVKDPIAVCKNIVDSRIGKERSFKNRWVWITWRNPVSNLSLYGIGLKINKNINEYKRNLGPIVFEKVICGYGWFYSFTIKYNLTRGFYYGFGWKFLDPADNRARFMYRISPYRAL